MERTLSHKFVQVFNRQSWSLLKLEAYIPFNSIITSPGMRQVLQLELA